VWLRRFGIRAAWYVNGVIAQDLNTEVATDLAIQTPAGFMERASLNISQQECDDLVKSTSILHVYYVSGE
jgi:hypothetical protein